MAEPIPAPPAPEARQDARQDRPEPPLAPEPTPADPAWSPALRLAFRFVFSYLVFLNLPYALGYLPWTGKIAEVYGDFWQAVALWVGRSVLHLRRALPVDPEAGGDTTVRWLLVLSMVVLAAVVTLVWTLVDRRSRHYRPLHDGMRVAVRYILGFTLFNYGMIKVIQTQFIVLHSAKLQQPYGDLSPMGLLWTFMSYSAAYNVFTGGAEAIGGLLLFFRRTTLLGALIVVAVMTHVVLINFSYDVTVKIYSTHLLLLGVFLLAPDLGRLADLLVWNRPTTPARKALPRQSFPKWARIGWVGLKLLFIGYFLVSMTRDRLEMKSKIEAMRASRLHKPPAHYFLTDRGFHWINEFPLDR
jgi:hypothetical protein